MFFIQEPLDSRVEHVGVSEDIFPSNVTSITREEFKCTALNVEIKKPASNEIAVVPSSLFFARV